MKAETRRGYEANRVDSARVWSMLALLLAAVALCLTGIAWWLHGEQQRGQAQQPSLSTLERERLLPPEPRLQSRPRQDGERQLDAQRIHLDSFGWVDQQQRIVHLPLDQARQLLLERGWPNAGEHANGP
ncbi:hypothetical protein [Pseudomonas sp. McL0111]|uniref:hypothetical protein n=1 Tax=Pseudomonas sp. McL0111 TaxID=3457357 RepID=UPI00403E46F9